MENNQLAQKPSTPSDKKQGPYFDEGRNELTRQEWVADRLYATFLAVNKPNPGASVLATMAEDLASELSDEQLLRGLSRLRKEREWVSVKAIIELSGSTEEDGRPGVETAWAMCPKNEENSTVWTKEMASAFGSCRTVLRDGDEIASRMIFKEQYSQLVSRARANHEPVEWSVSLGWNPDDRLRAVAEAIEHKRISANHGLSLLGFTQREELLQRLPSETRKMLVGETASRNTEYLNGLQKTLLQLTESKAMPEPEPIPSRTTSILDDPAKMDERRAYLKRQAEQVRK